MKQKVKGYNIPHLQLFNIEDAIHYGGHKFHSKWRWKEYQNEKEVG